jgi:hypothetical protein
MKPQSADEQPFPVQRAFVVQGHATAQVASGSLAGRGEHVLSGQAVHFYSVDELLAFMARVLAALDAGQEQLHEGA